MNLNSKLKQFVSIILAVICLLSSSISAYAYGFTSGGKFNSVPITFYVNTGTNSKYITDFQNALNTWNNAGFGTLFVYGGTRAVLTATSMDSVNGVTFVNRGSTVALANTTIYCDSSGTIYEANIEVNTHYTFKCTSDSLLVNGYDMQSMFTHELGHALGLDESMYIDATMYFNMPINETKKRTLHSDDIAGLAALGY